MAAENRKDRTQLEQANQEGYLYLLSYFLFIVICLISKKGYGCK